MEKNKYISNTTLSSTKYGNAYRYELEQHEKKRRNKILQWIFVFIIVMGYFVAAVAQPTGSGTNQTFTTTSVFEPSIKDAVMLTDLPEIKDTVKKISNINYGIQSYPLVSKYEVIPIDAAKMQNEPLAKLYRSLIKAGMGSYTTPYAEFWVSSLRTRDVAYGLHFKHLSSSAQLKGVGFSGFSDNEADIFAKKFYKKHTLTGEFNYKRNVVNYYGYDTSEFKVDKSFIRQQYQLFEPIVTLQSHYTDSSHINHQIKASYYNYADQRHASENNIRLNTLFNTYINKERLFVALDVDYYNHKLPNDTFNNAIIKLNPYFDAHGKKWKADIGLAGALDIFNSQGDAKFYFYPQLNAQYDVYESIIIPYAGINGHLKKNSFRSLSLENPFIKNTFDYKNTNTKFNIYGGLKGNLSSNLSYDASAKYDVVENMVFFVVDYDTMPSINNQYKVIYDNTNQLTVSGQLKYQYKEKLHVIAKGNYYNYQTSTLTRAYHKPDFDVTLSGIYNLKSKFIVKADIFVVGNQFALTQKKDTANKYYTEPKLLDGFFDANLGFEYRYTKMLSFFANFNNIANMRYYRWERYPSQRFNLMVGLTFVPF